MFSTPYNRSIANEVARVNSRFTQRENALHNGDALEDQFDAKQTGGSYSAGARTSGKKSEKRTDEYKTSAMMPLPMNTIVPHKPSGAFQSPANVAQHYHSGKSVPVGGARSAGAYSAGAYSAGAHSGGAKSIKGTKKQDADAKKAVIEMVMRDAGVKKATATKLIEGFAHHLKKHIEHHIKVNGIKKGGKKVRIADELEGGGFFGSIGHFFSKVGNGIVDAGKSVYHSVIQPVYNNVVKPVATSVWNGVKAVGSDALQLGMEGAQTAMGVLADGAHTAIGVAGQVAPQVISTIAENPELLAGLGKGGRRKYVKKTAGAISAGARSAGAMSAGAHSGGMSKAKIRGGKISKLMKEHGVSLGEASRMLKEQGH